MAIRPLEKKTNSGLMLKISAILLLLIAGAFYVSLKPQVIKDRPSVLGESTKTNIKKEGEKIVGSLTETATQSINDMVAAATRLVGNTATKSAQTISDYIFDNTVGNLLKQIDKLPPDQQENIRRSICK